MADKDENGKPLQPIIIKKIKKGGGHHGGAWKVAYADFVTAMMAFFLLLWLLNVTTDEQKNAISNYFDPTHPKISNMESGAGGVLGGLSMSPKGAMTTNLQPVMQPPRQERQSRGVEKKSKENGKKQGKGKSEAQKAEESRFKQTEAKIKQAIQDSPELQKLANNILVDMTPEGLRIQIVDQEGASMFPSGSAVMFAKTEALVAKITEIIKDLPNHISIRGHTDSSPYGAGATYTNWELSSDRANSCRRVMLANNFPVEHIHDVVGKADRDPLKPENPLDPQNRRISIILLKDEIIHPPQAEDTADQDQPEDVQDNPNAPQDDGGEDTSPGPSYPPIGTFRKTPGQVEFP